METEIEFRINTGVFEVSYGPHTHGSIKMSLTNDKRENKNLDIHSAQLDEAIALLNRAQAILSNPPSTY